MNRDLSYLLDIYQYGQDVVEFVQGMDEASFAADTITQRAVIYSVTVMGEATKKLSPEFRAQNPQIPLLDLLQTGIKYKKIHLLIFN